MATEGGNRVLNEDRLCFTGYVLRRTEEPDLDGDIIDVDGVTWDGDGHFVLKGLVPLRVVGYVDVERRSEGIWAEATIVDPGFIEAINPEGLAFHAVGRIYQREGKQITQVELTGVGICPRCYARSRGTEATLQALPTGVKDAQKARGNSHA